MPKKDYIYHYTSIETLALILRNKTIRFNSLGRVNDLDEAETKDMKDFGKYCLVSCWTKSVEESIPLWNMYTPGMKGVRIGLPKDMFDKTFDPNEKDYRGSSDKPLLNIEPQPAPFPDFFDVVYGDTTRSLINANGINGDILGRTKNPVWEFEQECRFRLFLIPHGNRTRFADLSLFNQAWKNNYKARNPKMVCDFLLREEIIKDMDIILGPKTSAGERIIVEALAEKNNIALKQITKSPLRIRG